jgi:hypothetical protein
MGPSPRLLEIQVALALRDRIQRRIAELDRAERDAEMQLIAIRTVRAELQAQLAPTAFAPPAPTAPPAAGN